MTAARKLPHGFTWRHELDQDTLYCHDVPVARVEPIVRGLMVRTLVRGPNLPPHETMVPTVERGIALPTRWAAARPGAIHEACERAHDAAPEAEHVAESPSIARWFQT